MNIDDAIKFAHDGAHGLIAAALAREVVRLRKWPTVVVPPLPKPAGLRVADAPVWGMPQDIEDVCRQAGNPVLAAYQAGIRRGHAIAENSVCTIPADRVLGDGMVGMDRNKIESAASFLEEYASRVPGISAVIAALRASQGGADHV